jgi:hypothetical protein
MKFFAFSSFVALALVTGCASSTDDAALDDAQNNEVNSAPKPRTDVNLSASEDASSVQGQLYTLLETFKADPELKVAAGIESPAYTMAGANEPNANRSVACHKAGSKYECTLQSFDVTRGGGELPSVIVRSDQEAPLASKLFTLLERGHEKGGLGVKQTAKNDNPPCCDIPLTETLAISDKNGELSCTKSTGGFAFIVQTRCAYTRAIAPNE